MAQKRVNTDLGLVVRQGTGTKEGRAAWVRLAQGGPETMLPILREMKGRDTVACNWLRAAPDRIVALYRIRLKTRGFHPQMVGKQSN